MSAVALGIIRPARRAPSMTREHDARRLAPTIFLPLATRRLAHGIHHVDHHVAGAVPEPGVAAAGAIDDADRP